MNYLKIGSFLQALRKSKGLTQAELAEYFEVSSKTISKWECGDALPEVPMLKALAEYYDITVDEILNGEIGVKKTEKTKKDNQKYFYFKVLKKLKLFSLMSYSILILAFLLIFIIAYTAIREDIACWVSIAITYASGVFYAIGILLTGQLDSEFDETLIHSYKTKKFWLIYSYIFTTIYVTTCAIYPYAYVRTHTNIVNSVLSIDQFLIFCFLITLPCIVVVAGIYPLFKFLLWKQIIKLCSNLYKVRFNAKAKKVLSIICIVVIHLIFAVSIIVLFACPHFHQFYYTGQGYWKDKVYNLFYIWDIFSVLGWIGLALVVLSWISFIILWLKKKNIFIPYLAFSLGFVMIIIEMNLYSFAHSNRYANMDLVFYYFFLIGFYILLATVEAIKFFKNKRSIQ